MEGLFGYLTQLENMLFTASLIVFVVLAVPVLCLLVDLLVSYALPESWRRGFPYYRGTIVILGYVTPFFGFFGLLGLFSNWFLADTLNLTVTLSLIISTLLSGGLSCLLSARIGRYIASIWPVIESYGLTNADLVGCLGTVVGEKMDSENKVRISVTDKRNNIFTLRGQMLAGHSEVLHGGLVKIVNHVEASETCYCEPASDSDTQASPSEST
jgi:hypothetical protein